MLILDDAPAPSEDWPLDVRIECQVAFYFSDENLRRDRYMISTIGLKATGWFPVSELLGWPRMRRLTANKELVVSVMRTMYQLRKDQWRLTVGERALLAVSAAGNFVRRVSPVVTPVATPF